jgi:hypothetical protein
MAKKAHGTPLALSDEMLSALLEGRKKLTVRSISKREHSLWETEDADGWPIYETNNERWVRVKPPYGPVGSYLWVRESYRIDDGNVIYKHRDDPENASCSANWLPVVGMPEAHSRMKLIITGYRFLPGIQLIKTRDIRADGYSSLLEDKQKSKLDVREQFARAWNTRYREDWQKWEANPAAWITEFELETK